MNLGIEWILAYHEQEFEWISLFIIGDSYRPNELQAAFFPVPVAAESTRANKNRCQIYSRVHQSAVVFF